MANADCRMEFNAASGIRQSTLALMVVTKDVVVANERGLHARPAMQFVDVANTFQSQVTVVKEGPEPFEVDGKSVMQMITLEATQGTVLHVKAEGDDAQAAVDKLAELFESRFGEE
ncbi:MAG TPA: HPr family phosphocarrier protein [Tepidisphaeraceae bacterium]|nr:HPr family phosphocarrier protein [Tepidisphaeraceae bacterium]